MRADARVAPHDDLRDAAARTAAEVLQTAPEARMHFKRAVNAGYGVIDHMTFAASINAPECREGFEAFLERRSPAWVPGEFRRDERL